MKNIPMAINKAKGTSLEIVIKLLTTLETLTPNIFTIVKPMINIKEMTSFAKSLLKAGMAAPSAVAKPTAIAAQAITVTTHLRTPTSKPQKSPSACLAYR